MTSRPTGAKFAGMAVPLLILTLAVGGTSMVPNVALNVGGAWRSPSAEHSALVVGGEVDLYIALVEGQQPLAFGRPAKRTGYGVFPFVEGVWASDPGALRLTTGLGFGVAIPWRLFWPLLIGLAGGYVRQWNASAPNGVAVRLQATVAPLMLAGAYVRADTMFAGPVAVEGGLTLNLLLIVALIDEL